MNTKKNLKIASLLSALTIAIGMVLMIFMILVENEPGVIPLLLIIVGTGWHFIIRHNSRSQHT